MRLVRPLAWLLTLALVVLTARTLGYALAPSPLALALAHEAGGPRLTVIVLIFLGGALVLATVVVGIAALAVRERRLLAPQEIALPPLRLGLLATRAALLFTLGSLLLAYLESYLHWRAGLGWHGLRCLLGPVHRDMIPIVGALSIVAAAIVAAAEHLLAWARRTIARYRAVPRLRRRLEPRPAPESILVPMLLSLSLAARGPPAPAASA